MKRWLLLFSSALAATVPVSAIASQAYSPVQAETTGVAGFEHLFPVRPACHQMASTPSEQAGWRRWGYNHQGSFIQVYGLEEMALENAYFWLQDAGLCVWGGDTVNLDSLPQAPVEGPNAAPSAAALAERIQSSSDESESVPFGSAVFIVVCLTWIALEFRPEKETPARDLQMPEPVSPPAITLPATPRMPTANIPYAVSSPEAITIPEVSPSVSDSQTAVGEILKAPLYTRIFLGGQRSGKSFAASKLSQYLKQHNGTKIFAINLALVKNPEYWYHADKAAIADLTAPSITEGSALKAIKDARAVLEEFKHHKNALLLIDEWTIIGATTFKFNGHLKPFLDDVCSAVTALASRGLQADQAVWLIAPHCRLDFLEKSAKALKLCRLCLVAANPVNPFDVDGNLITFDSELYGQVKNNWTDMIPPDQGIDSLDSERIAFINGQWLPLGSVEVPVTNSVTAGYTTEPTDWNSVTPDYDSSSAIFYTRLSEVTGLTVTEISSALQALSQGISKTQIIKNIWGYTGRYYSEYSDRFEHLKNLMEANESA